MREELSPWLPQTNIVISSTAVAIHGVLVSAGSHFCSLVTFLFFILSASKFLIREYLRKISLSVSTISSAF